MSPKPNTLRKLIGDDFTLGIKPGQGETKRRRTVKIAIHTGWGSLKREGWGGKCSDRHPTTSTSNYGGKSGERIQNKNIRLSRRAVVNHLVEGKRKKLGK